MAKAGGGTIIYVTGNRELDGLLSNFEQKIVKGMFRKATRVVAKALKPKIDAATPVKTGALKKSMKIRALKRSRKAARVGVEIRTKDGWFKGDEFYGAFVELGTKRITPRRFVRDTTDRFQGEANQIFEQEIGAAIDEAW